MTQYCKQAKCWTAYLDRSVYVSAAARAEILSGIAGTKTPGRANADTVAEKETVRRVKAIDSKQWFAIHSWGENAGVLNRLQLDKILTFALIARTGTTFSTRNANEAVKILDAVSAKGYTLKL